VRDTPPHLKALEEVEREGIPSLTEVLREEDIDAVRYALWYAPGWHRDYTGQQHGGTGLPRSRKGSLGYGGEEREDSVHGA
jgi:hypothetical protein